MLLFLFAFVALYYSSEVATAQSGDRSIRYGTSGSGNNQVCYLISAEYDVLPNVSARGNVFSAAMGINIGATAFPWVAMAYVKGEVDATTYNGSLDQVHVDAQGAVIAWTYVGIGEFCDNNSIEGYQPLLGDYIINYYLAPQAISYNEACGAGNDPVTGDMSYYGSIETALGRFFNVTCRIFPRTTSVQYNGRFVSPYDFKCDVRLDYSLLWSLNATQINGCPDSKRKIGVLVYVAGSSFDVDYSTANLNTAAPNTADANEFTFGASALAFKWDNYAQLPSTFSGTSTTLGVVTATHLGVKTVDSSNQVYSVNALAEVIYAFDTPKSAGQNIFYWDPTVVLVDTTGAGQIVFSLSLILSFITLMLL